VELNCLVAIFVLVFFWWITDISASPFSIVLIGLELWDNKEFLIFQVLGNAKGAVAVVVSILIFRNPVSVTGMLGYSLTVFGVVLYSEAKKRSKWWCMIRGKHLLRFPYFIYVSARTAATFQEASSGCGWCHGIWLSGFYIFCPGNPSGWFPFVSATTAGLARSRILK